MVTKRRDDGAILVLTLIFTIVLAIIVLAIASYATVGLRTSEAATTRSETNADASAAVTWAIEQFAKKQLLPDVDCGQAPSSIDIPIPTALQSAGFASTLTCQQTTPISGEPVVHLVSTATPAGSMTRTVEATVEVPRYTHGARVSDWRVDIPIDVPNFVTTTTVASTTTTVANVAPTASATNWTFNPGAPATFALNATDTDGTIVSSTIDVMGSSPSFTGTVTSAGPDSWTIDGSPAVDTYTMSFTVTDDDGATSAPATVIIDVTSVATTSTTTTTAPPAPNLACEFRITSISNGGNRGSGTLSLSNPGGGGFTGWQVRVNPSNGSGAWSFTWPVDVGVTGTYDVSNGASNGTVTANQSITGVASAALNSGPPSVKLTVGETFPCTPLAP